MKILLSLLFIASSLQVFAQNYTGIAASYLNQNNEKYNFQPQDINDLRVSSSAYSKSLNATTVYISQYYQGRQVLNSSSMFLIKDNQVLSTSLSFHKNISNTVNNTTASTTASSAVQQALNYKNLSFTGVLQPVNSQIDDALQFMNTSISHKAITVTPVYVSQENDLILSWQVYLETIDKNHMYMIYVDAVNGNIIKEYDLMLHCNFSSHNEPGHVHKLKNQFSLTSNQAQSTVAFTDNSSYNVYVLPKESPNYGTASIITSPADLTASPYGWHDTDGAVGPEFTITRGNNVYAQEDFDGANNTLGNAPDGTVSLDFNFPQQLDVPARDNISGATVNLFYMNNVMHDVFYHYGFDEASGNFQANNYGNGGLDRDFVVADAQDGSGFNNASFGTPGDGSNPRMNMFLWNAPTTGGSDIFTITNGNLSGSYDGVPASFGASLPSASSPIIADLALVNDDNSLTISTDATDACDVILNGTALSGKIAVLRRGSCQFGTKIVAVENQGAIAAIVINNELTAPFSMGAGNDGFLVTIPSIMVSQIDGDRIIIALQNGNSINAVLNNNGLFNPDGSLDNGIIAHEYGHGISTRLTGGASNPTCLFNDEQMGEGWSDWFSLILTIEPGDQGTDSRGLGTYAINQPVTHPGIRNFPYSTDMNINPNTYADTNLSNFTAPHGIGSIWGTMLWDLSWRFIEDYGYDTDLYNGTGGNNIVMQLILDAMKLQPCEPGFVDGRDAILQADLIANGGVNTDRIWDVFANRGLGLSADQGDPFSRFDQIEAFDKPAPLSLNDLSVNNFSIYPNPTNGIVIISSKNTVENGVVSIIDLNGRLVFTKKTNFTAVEKIDLSTLRSGVYIARIQGTDLNYVTKIIMD